jgi:hypothetical protein
MEDTETIADKWLKTPINSLKPNINSNAPVIDYLFELEKGKDIIFSAKSFDLGGVLNDIPPNSMFSLLKAIIKHFNYHPFLEVDCRENKLIIKKTRDTYCFIHKEKLTTEEKFKEHRKCIPPNVKPIIVPPPHDTNSK